MNFQRLETAIMRDEGLRLAPYQCSRGVWTIGYGATTMLGRKVMRHTRPISTREAEIMLGSDIFKALKDAQAVVPSFDQHNDIRQEILVNMAFNLGRTGLGRFTKMLSALSVMDYVTAADEMRDSRWYRQVGARADRLAHQMLTGEA